MLAAELTVRLTSRCEERLVKGAKPSTRVSCAAQGLIGELAKDEQGFVRELQKEEKLVEQGLGRAEAFLERIERTYTLPPWLRWLYSLGLPMPSMPNM